MALVPATSVAAPKDRAYELVTPAGDEPRVLYGSGPATPDGNTVCFNSEWAIAGSAPNGIVTAGDGYCARRTGTGWETEWVTGPMPAETTANTGSQVYFVSPDGKRAVYASDAGLYPDDPGSGPGESLRYPPKVSLMWDGGPMPRLLTPSPSMLPEDMPGSVMGRYSPRAPAAVADDLRHGVFHTVLQLLPEDQNSDVDAYQWTPDGVEVLSRDASGQAVGGVLPFFVGTQTIAQPGTMSRDGSRAFFQRVGPLDGAGADDVMNVFRREGDEVVHVSPRRGPAGPAADVRFEGASADGQIVYLRSQQQLTAEPKQAGDALYRYDVESDDLDLAVTAAGGVRFLDVSADGSTVVYGTSVTTAARQLWVYRDGASSLLGALASSDVTSSGHGLAVEAYGRRPLRTAPDGSQVVFASAGTYPGSAGGAGRQVYRWTPAGAVERISAADPSVPSASASMIGNFTQQLPGVRYSPINLMRQFVNVGRVLADDGRIFFESPDRLVPADENHFFDVYEWHDGELALVTPGTQDEHALYHDSSADGSTVFFTTYARILPEVDRNAAFDLYAAREGGGFTLPKRLPCGGDECQGSAPADSPSTPQPGSTTLNGAGNVRSPAVAGASSRPRLLAITPAAKRALARRGRATLRVRVARGGRVTITARTQIGGRRVRVGRATRIARARGVVRLRLRLSRRARSVLADGGRLRVAFTATHSRSDRAVRRVVVVRG